MWQYRSKPFKNKLSVQRKIKIWTWKNFYRDYTSVRETRREASRHFSPEKSGEKSRWTNSLHSTLSDSRLESTCESILPDARVWSEKNVPWKWSRRAAAFPSFVINSFLYFRLSYLVPSKSPRLKARENRIFTGRTDTYSDILYIFYLLS